MVIEYNHSFPAAQAATVEYADDYRAAEKKICGASLGALVKLGRRKGYRLVHCDRTRVNAFFVRRGIGEEELPEVDPEPFCSSVPRALPAGWVEV